MELGKIICVPDPAEAAARDEAMSAAVTDEVTAMPAPPLTGPLLPADDPVAGTSSLAGRQFPQPSVRSAASTTCTEPGGVSSRSTTPPIDLEPQLVDWFAAIGGSTVVVASADDDRRNVRRLVRRARCPLGAAATRLPRPRRRLRRHGAAGLLVDLRNRLPGRVHIMSRFTNAFGPHAPDATYVAHGYEERLFDTGEVEINYVTAGDASQAGAAADPGQTESWWGYEEALPLLAEHFQAYAVDLRGQGRSSRTPGRYTLDNIGNDLVRFIDGVIGRPTIVAGLSSGGVISAWLSAYASPGQVVGAYYEDPPLFSSEVRPAVGQSIAPGIGPIFAHMAKYLGDQWSIGDWEAMVAAIPTELPGVDGHPRRALRAGTATDRRRAQGVRPRVGPGLLVGQLLRRRAPRADAALGEGPGAVHPPLPGHRRGDRGADGRELRPPGRRGSASS